MVERIKQIPAKLLEAWSKYTSKQKTIIISVVAAIILALILWYMVVSRTQYVVLQKFDTASNASELTDLLAEQNIKYKLSNSGRTVSVDEKKSTEAMVLMSKNDIPQTGLSWLDALNNDMSTTQSERELKASLATKNEIRSYLVKFDGVSDATVNITLASSENTLFAEQEDTYVSVMLTLSDPISEETARGIAKWLATAVGNPTTERITIIDSSGKQLFNGQEETGLGTSVANVDEFKERLRNQTASNIKLLLINMGYDEVQIGTSNLVYDMTKINEIYTEYTVADGREEGFLQYQYTYNATGQNGTSGVPGTTSNDGDTDYEMLDSNMSNSEIESIKSQYLTNERVQNIDHEIGAFKSDESSLGIVLKEYVIYDQAALERQGTLEDTTWEEFVDTNNVRTEITEIPPNLLTVISKTCGVAEENIAVSIWQEPIFNATVEEKTNFTNYLMIILAVLILALLIFVVFKGTAPVEVTEAEPELSVTDLLATTKEGQSLEDIEYGEMSETRKMIEKFVEEKPDAVAQLLRNWLNEDWG